MTTPATLPLPIVSYDPNFGNPASHTLKKKEHSFFERAISSTMSVSIGGLFLGYVFYGMTRLCVKIKLLDNPTNVIITPLPYILSVASMIAIVEAAGIVYDIGVKILGKTEENSQKGGFCYRKLRSRLWKVVRYTDKIQNQMDQIYSSVFKVRTEKEIYKSYIKNKDLYLMEIVRRALVSQIKESVGQAVPQELGVAAVEALGYTVLGGHIFLWLHGLLFVGGAINKVSLVYIDIMNEEIKAVKRAKAREKAQANAQTSAQDQTKAQSELQKEGKMNINKREDAAQAA